MSLFGKKEKKQIQFLQRELSRARKENRRLKNLCAEKLIKSIFSVSSFSMDNS